MNDPINRQIGFRYQKEDFTPIKRAFLSIIKGKILFLHNKFGRVAYGYVLALVILVAFIIMRRCDGNLTVTSPIVFGVHRYSLDQVVDTLLSLGIVEGVYRDSLTSRQKDIYFESRAYTAREALDYALKGASLEYNLRGKILEFFDRTLYYQMTGRVNDANCHPIAGVSVMLKRDRQSISPITDANGLFVIFIKPTDKQLFLNLYGDIDSIEISTLRNAHRVHLTMDSYLERNFLHRRIVPNTERCD